jgi:hypothetical protein
MSLANRPRPNEDRDSAPWWAAVRRHELTVQRCDGCGVPRFPPRTVCNRCRSFAWSWLPVSGRGRVYSWVVTHQVFAAELADEVPYTVLLVSLAEAPDIRMYGNLAGPGEPYADAPVRAVFVDAADDLTLVQWRLEDPAARPVPDLPGSA